MRRSPPPRQNEPAPRTPNSFRRDIGGEHGIGGVAACVGEVIAAHAVMFFEMAGMMVRSQAREVPVSSPIEMPRAKPVPVEPATKISLEVASAEPNRAAAYFRRALGRSPKRLYGGG